MNEKAGRSLMVVFGLPGAGKSYVAQVLHRHFGYFVYDGDTDIPKGMREALNRRARITDTMRREFLAGMIASVGKLTQTHPKLAIHQTFIKEFMRKAFLDAFPHAQFILVEISRDIGEKRYMKRAYFNLGLPYLRHMCSLFEQPRIPHTIIKNNTDGITEVMKQLQKILTQGNP